MVVIYNNEKVAVIIDIVLYDKLKLNYSKSCKVYVELLENRMDCKITNLFGNIDEVNDIVLL